MNIREINESEFDDIWPIFKPIARAGETYAFTKNISESEAKKIWLDMPRKTFIAERDGKVLGTYYLKTNQAGPGMHVCNCGYMVSPSAQGKGVATVMCKHSQQIAKGLGYEAMQFNYVASSNEGAIRLWLKLGFEIVGRLPRAFNHPTNGYIDALVMYKWLGT